MTPQNIDPAVLTEKLHLLASRLGTLAELGAVTRARIDSEIMVVFPRTGFSTASLRLSVERIMTQLVDLAAAINMHVAAAHGTAPATPILAN